MGIFEKLFGTGKKKPAQPEPPKHDPRKNYVRMMEVGVPAQTPVHNEQGEPEAKEQRMYWAPEKAASNEAEKQVQETRNFKKLRVGFERDAQIYDHQINQAKSALSKWENMTDRELGQHATRHIPLSETTKSYDLVAIRENQKQTARNQLAFAEQRRKVVAGAMQALDEGGNLKGATQWVDQKIQEESDALQETLAEAQRLGKSEATLKALQRKLVQLQAVKSELERGIRSL